MHVPPRRHGGHGSPALASALARENKCSSHKDLPGSAVSQTVSSGVAKIDSSDLNRLMRAYNCLPIRKLRIGIFARVSC